MCCARDIGEDHPDVVALRDALENIRREEERRAAAVTAAAAPAPSRMTKPVPSGPPPVVVSSAAEAKELIHAREQVSTLKAQLEAAAKDLTDRLAGQERILREIHLAQSHLERLPVREQEMAGITRDYEISKTNYKALLDKKLAAEMALDMERRQKSERFTVIIREGAEKPIKPKRRLLYAIGTAASLALGHWYFFAGGTAERRPRRMGIAVQLRCSGEIAVHPDSLLRCG